MHNQVKRIAPSGDPVRKFFNPLQIFSHLWQFRGLIGQLTRREIVGRYKGSFIGMGWAVIHPVLMLCVYTFVFSVIFKAKWGVGPVESNASFALALFTGLITFSIFSEVVNAAPTVVLRHSNYVKKVVFPLEILPVVGLLCALVNSLFSLGVLFAGIILINHSVQWTALLLPVIWLPMLLFTLGCAYFLSALGVFMRDIGATVGIVTTMLFFLTPIFYPIQAVPMKFRIFNEINPIAVFVEASRKVVLWGILPDRPGYVYSLALALTLCIAGFVWFMKSKRGFVDVV